ncbi:lasso peptide biosynthesis B2 protein [Caulobacter sp.]|uniref:lasso peptide biosynthesis B2 protein n=1 Tax=Caulobacter sp. TaxID=78 RepID=UPI0031D73FCD
MSYTFREGVHAVRSGGQIIVFDERANRYLGLTRRQELALLSATKATPPDAEVIAPLLRRDLLISAPRFSADLSPAHPPPKASLIEDNDPEAASLRDIVGAMAAFCVARRTIAEHRLSGVLDQQRRAPNARPAQTPAETLARRFLTARLWAPWTPVCLLDSVAMLQFLRQAGHVAQLVIGVRTSPFEAHCWVERRGVALNETLLRARSFTPIVVA